MPHLIERPGHRYRRSHVTLVKLKLRMIRKMRQIFPRPGDQIIQRYNTAAVR